MTAVAGDPGAHLRVRGNATPEELAAVLAVMAGRADAPAIRSIDLWRSRRLAALRRTPPDCR